jgi:hypothetical protein
MWCCLQGEEGVFWLGLETGCSGHEDVGIDMPVVRVDGNGEGRYR